MSPDQPTGVDLARVALTAAKEAAKQRGADASTRRTPKRRPLTRPNGRDPLGLGGALAQLVAEHGWEAPAAGGTVIDQWEAIATPAVAEHLQATAFDKSTGRLDLVPANNAWATQARLITASLIQRANERVGTEAVRQIRVLPVGTRTRTGTEPPTAAPAPARRGDIRTRETASAGYHLALDAIPTTPAAEPATPPVRTREDGCDGYQQAQALMKNPPTPPPADRPPVRTRADGCDGYRQALENVGAPVPARQQPETQARTRELASTGYQLARRAHLEARGRSRPAPHDRAAPGPRSLNTNESSPP